MGSNQTSRGKGGKRTTPAEAGRPSSRRRPSTKQLLIDVGEQLFGQKGFDGISLREIATAAGQANSNVVQYHFEDKAGLIAAILEDRLERIEQVRCMQLAILDEATINARQLLKVLWLPFMAIKDDQGNHSFCRFMLQYNMMHPKLAPHPFAGLYNNPYEIDSEVTKRLPCGRDATFRLLDCFPQLARDVLLVRVAALANMFLSHVIAHDNKRAAGLVDADTPYDIEPILDLSVGAIGAPVSGR